ncbi:MAG: glycoside hydrolase family 18 protein [Planctomycetota bacterium]|nr:glycoside hydrolase family 18 protein [Planctomycetota bacterium]
MRHPRHCFFLLTALLACLPAILDAQAGSQPRRIVGYYTSWSVYARNYHVAQIPGDKITHINYAFANLTAGKIVLGDRYADIDKFYPGDSWAPGALRGNFNQLHKLKQKHPQLRTLISIGGWTWSGNFSDAVLTQSARRVFAQSCVDFIVQYGFDGVDLDWEYPGGGGLGGNTSRPQDPQNFTLFLQELRSQLDARGKTNNTRYLMTIAAGAGPSKIAKLEVEKIHPLLDWINIMTYDYHGPWKGAGNPVTNFNAPLHPSSADPTQAPFKTDFNIARSVALYLARGVPRGKLQVGLAFYGRGYGGVSASSSTGLFASYTGVPGRGTWENGVFDFDDIASNYAGKNGYTVRRDSESRCPWVYSPTARIMISYDDRQSIEDKVWFIKGAGLGGAMFWEFSGDRQSALLDVVASGIRHAPRLWSDHQAMSVQGPSRARLRIETDVSHARRGYVVVFGLSGRRPGLPLPGGTFPINPDLVFDLSLALANSSVFPGTIGVLGTDGSADLALDLRGQQLGAALIGLDLSAAAWILRSTAALNGQASNPLDIRFTR